MKCDKCGKRIGAPDCSPPFRKAYQVRVGEVEEDEVTFTPDEDVSYFCSECLKDGV